MRAKDLILDKMLFVWQSRISRRPPQVCRRHQLLDNYISLFFDSVGMCKQLCAVFSHTNKCPPLRRISFQSFSKPCATRQRFVRFVVIAAGRYQENTADKRDPGHPSHCSSWSPPDRISSRRSGQSNQSTLSMSRILKCRVLAFALLAVSSLPSPKKIQDLKVGARMMIASLRATYL